MADSNKQYEYFAFISYKREDEKWAKWLQRKLEYYKLPSSVRRDNPDLPEKIRPVFKDTTDLEPGVLAQKIQDALNSSKFLIVICSPRSANSVWVSKEVQSFIDSGRADHIIPFIIGGTPNATDPKDECFSEGLRQLAGEQELLGANINEMGRDAAAIKVVARMFNLRFDTLWQRYEKQKLKKRAIIFSVITVLILMCIGVGMYIYRQNLILENTNSAKKLTEHYLLLEQAKELIRSGNAYGALYEMASIDSDGLGLTILEPAIRESFDSILYGKNSIGKYSKLPYDIMQIEINRSNGTLYASDGSSIKSWNIETQETTNDIHCPIDMEDIGLFDINDKYNLISITEGRGNTTKLLQLSDSKKEPLYESDGYGIFFDTTSERIWECKNICYEKAVIIVKSISDNTILTQFNGCIMGISPSRNKFVYSTFSQDGNVDKYYMYDIESGQRRVLNLDENFGSILFDDNGQYIYIDYNYGKELLKNNVSVNTDNIRTCLSYEDGIAINFKDGTWTLSNGRNNTPLYAPNNITAIKKMNDRYLLVGYSNGTISIINNPFYRNELYTFTSSTEREIEYWDNRLDSFKINPNNNYFTARLSNDKSLICMGSLSGEILILNGASKISLNQIDINKEVNYVDFTPDNKYIGVIADGKNFIIYRTKDFVQVSNYNLELSGLDILIHSLSFDENDEYYIAKLYGSQYTGPDVKDMPYSPEINELIWENYHPVECTITIPKFEKLKKLLYTTRVN